MGLLEKWLKQSRPDKPSGRFGRYLGRSMNFGHARLIRWGLSHISIKPDACILDVGCGGGRAVQELATLAPRGKVYGIDYAEDMVQVSQKVNDALIKQGSVEIMHGTVSSLPFTDNRLDLVTAFDTYYFWPHLIDDLKEVKRALKPTGTLLIVTDLYKDDRFEKRNSRFVAALDMQLHTPDEFKEFLTKAGLHTITIDTIPEKNWIATIAEKGS
jgi:ubiquinone/menaquinone biosynthesis C-methylase UbiE